MSKPTHDIAEPADKPKVEPHHELIVRNEKGQFLPGHIGIGGRKVGARSILTTRFLDDLAASWEREGASALARCAAEDPTGYVRVVANLLPKEALLAVSADVSVKVAQDAASAFALLAKLPKHELLELQANAVDSE
jgi:hypothetical protein